MNFYSPYHSRMREPEQGCSERAPKGSGAGESGPPKSDDWPSRVRRAVQSFIERLLGGGLDSDPSRLALYDIEDKDLSEAGRCIRRELVRKRQDAELHKPVSERFRQLPITQESNEAEAYGVQKIYNALMARKHQIRMQEELVTLNPGVLNKLMELDDLKLKELGITRIDLILVLMKKCKSQDF